MTTMSPIRGGILHHPTSQEGRYSQSLERGLAILRAFTPERPWLGIAELADELEMSRPTTHRYASTLVALDYLEQGPRRKYRLGMRAGDPGRSAVSSTPLGHLPPRYLSALRDASMCSAGIAVLHGSDIVYIDRARSSWQGHSEVSVRLGRGSRLPARSTALGRVLLAYLPDAGGEGTTDAKKGTMEASEGTMETGEGTIQAGETTGDAEQDVVGNEQFQRELETVRKKGFAIAEQVLVEGQQCVAAPIRSRSAEVIAAVDVAAPNSDFSRSRVTEQLVPLVLECAQAMSAYLGYLATD